VKNRRRGQHKGKGGNRKTCHDFEQARETCGGEANKNQKSESTDDREMGKREYNHIMNGAGTGTSRGSDHREPKQKPIQSPKKDHVCEEEAWGLVEQRVR